MGDLSTVNRVKYAGFDFDTHVDDLRARIQVKFAADYNDFALASLGMMLLDIIAFGLDTLSFYLDRRATEVYLSTARTRRGVSRLSRQLGYKMGGAVAASTDLQISINNPQPVDVTIPIGFQFNGPNSLLFQASKEVTWTSAEQVAGTIKPVPVSEGETVSETFSSDGTANQVFDLRSVPDTKFPTQGTVTATVDGSDWDEVEFLGFGATDQFEVAFNDDPPTIRFGDGVIGNIPVTNASIVISYLATSGKTGNVAANTIQAATTGLVVAGVAIDLAIDNASKAVGGDDPETLAHAKAFAGRVFNSRQVAVTQNDYTALSGAFADPVYGRVAVAQAISSRSAVLDLFLQVQLAIISNGLAAPVADINSVISTNADSSVSTSIFNLALAALGTGDDSVQGAATAAATSVATIETNVESTLASIRGNRNITLEIDTESTSGKASVDALGPAPGSGALSGPEADGIKAYFDAIISKSTSIRGGMESQLATLGAVKDETNKLGADTNAAQLDGTDSYLKIINDQANAVILLIGSDDTDDPSLSTGLFFDLNKTLQDAANALDPSLTGNTAADIANALQAIHDHVDQILAADCQANLVSVPILVRDAAGFYTIPSNALVDSLQTYLEARKEVTQTVRVVGGGDFLLFPVITARVGVLQGFSLEQTRTAVETAIDGVLRDREFGVDLFKSDLTTAILAIEGVAFTNVTVSGYTTLADTSTQTDLLDSDGNLIIEPSHVITKLPGSVTVTPETAASSLVLTP
jgi:hypothetical protein